MLGLYVAHIKSIHTSANQNNFISSFTAPGSTPHPCHLNVSTDWPKGGRGHHPITLLQTIYLPHPPHSKYPKDCTDPHFAFNPSTTELNLIGCYQQFVSCQTDRSFLEGFFGESMKNWFEIARNFAERRISSENTMSFSDYVEKFCWLWAQSYSPSACKRSSALHAKQKNKFLFNDRNMSKHYVREPTHSSSGHQTGFLRRRSLNTLMATSPFFRPLARTWRGSQQFITQEEVNSTEILNWSRMLNQILHRDNNKLFNWFTSNFHWQGVHQKCDLEHGWKLYRLWTCSRHPWWQWWTSDLINYYNHTTCNIYFIILNLIKMQEKKYCQHSTNKRRGIFIRNISTIHLILLQAIYYVILLIEWRKMQGNINFERLDEGCMDLQSCNWCQS